MMKLLLILFAGLALVAQAGESPEITVNLANVHPTQMQIGMAAVRAVAQTTYVDAAIGTDPTLADFKSRVSTDPKNPKPPLKSLAQLSPEQRNVLREKLATYLAKNPPQPVRAVRGPDDSIYITDGHHRTTALEVLTLEGSPPLVDPKLAKIRVRIAEGGNYLGRTADFEKFVAAKGFFTREVRESFERKELSTKQLLGRLPRTMNEMVSQDLPLRSTIGKVFFDLGIKGDPFEDYLEFFIGEQVACESGSLAGHEFDDATLERTRRAIFGNPDIVAYLRTKELPEPDKTVAEAQIGKALTSYEVLEKDRTVQGIAQPEPSACTSAKAAADMVKDAVKHLIEKFQEPASAAVELDDAHKSTPTPPLPVEPSQKIAPGPGNPEAH